MKLTFNEQTNTFDLQCGYQDKDVPKSAGFKWNPDSKVWWTSNPDIACELLQYGDSNVIVKIDELKNRNKSAVDESQATDCDIDIPKPDGLEYMPFQKAGISYADKRNDTLIADEMGLGKTIQAIGVINLNSDIKKVLVVCPATMKLVWKSELEKWLVNSNLKIAVWDTKTQEDANIIIINYDILSRFDMLKRTTFSILVADEIHYL